MEKTVQMLNWLNENQTPRQVVLLTIAFHMDVITLDMHAEKPSGFIPCHPS